MILTEILQLMLCLLKMHRLLLLNQAVFPDLVILYPAGNAPMMIKNTSRERSM